MPRAAGTPPTAYRRAVLRLARRDQTAAELRSALLQRGHEPDEVEAAIERLRRERFVDDGRYAERFARSRLAHQGLGRTRIRLALRERGVEAGQLEDGIRAALEEVDEAAVLEQLARRYWRQHLRVPPERRLPRLWAFLVRRGFPAPLVRERLRALWPRWRDALDGAEPLPADEGAQDAGKEGRPTASPSAAKPAVRGRTAPPARDRRDER